MPRTLTTPRQKNQPDHFFVLGSRARLRLPERVSLWKPSDLKKTVPLAPGRTVFVSLGQDATDALLRASVERKKRDRFDQLLAIDPPRPGSVPALLGVFKAVVGYGANYHWLPVNELLKVLTAREAAIRFIAGAADHQTETLALVRGNGQTMVVPFSDFLPTGTGSKPDFHALALADFGHTVVLGDYEASTDAILYEADPEYRRQLKKDRQRSEQTFGASLTRLRIQKRLKQTDFAPLAAKTIARIESGEVEKPHGNTLAIIAKRLGVPSDLIETY